MCRSPFASVEVGPQWAQGTMPLPPPDIVFLAPEWQPRALIRAQLIEEGFEVVATRSWPMMRRHLRPGSKPRLAIVDLKDLADPRSVLRDLAVLMKPDRVLVLSARSEERRVGKGGSRGGV